MSKEIPGLSIVESTINFLAQMKLKEKVSQMVHNSQAIERLGIKKCNWWNQCLQGVSGSVIDTFFPQTMGMSATWNETLIYDVADAISHESRAKYHEFDRKGEKGENKIYQWHTYRRPNITIFCDPRWGRGIETYGKDLFLTSIFAVSFIKVLQANHPRYLKLIATSNHFALYSAPENSRHSFDAQSSVRDLLETYFPLFK